MSAAEEVKQLRDAVERTGRKCEEAWAQMEAAADAIFSSPQVAEFRHARDEWERRRRSAEGARERLTARVRGAVLKP
jgi:hypothetical protein